MDDEGGVRGGPNAQDAPAPRRPRREAVPLEQLIRLLAGGGGPIRGGGPDRHEGVGGHEELIQSLKRAGMLTSEAVAKAMLVVPRGAFVPPAYQAEAWVDTPIRVEEEDFNISAPHMHAQMLASLDIQPGDRVLDVGCGCGFIAACAAVLAGKQGTVVGVDIKPACISLSSDNISRLRASSSSYASSACTVTLLRHNIFIPSASLKGKFNKVCVGATCPEERLHLLLPLLEPGGGLLLAPVDSDLRLYSRVADGKLRQRVVSSVRFSDLEVPCDAGIALAVLQEEQAAQMRVLVSQPSLADDLAADGGDAHKDGCSPGFMHMWSSCFSSFNSLEAAGAAHSLGSSCGASGSLPAPDTPILAATKAALGTPPSDVSAASSSRAASAAMAAAAAAPGAPAGDKGMPARASSSSSRSVSAGSEDACPSLADTDTHMDDPPHAAFGAEEHGEPDCELLGSGWRLAAHKRVLKSRAAHFRARLSSGMRDAHDCQHKVPEGFSQGVMSSLLAYIYRDTLPDGLDPPAVVQLLYAASYYGTPRLIELCEARLVHELMQLPRSAAAAEAPHLLCLADELGLLQLRRAAVAFIAQHYSDVQASDAWAQLTRGQVELVATQLAGELGGLKQLLADLQPPPGVTAAPKRRGWW